MLFRKESLILEKQKNSFADFTLILKFSGSLQTQPAFFEVKHNCDTNKCLKHIEKGLNDTIKSFFYLS